MAQTEQNDAWAVKRARCMSLETIAPLGDTTMTLTPPNACTRTPFTQVAPGLGARAVQARIVSIHSA